METANLVTYSDLWQVLGIFAGIGSGTGESRNWVAAAGVADGKSGVVIDYVPVFASPCGMGFAYWDV